MRIRFSLRMLLIATALLAAFCYWLILPTIVAQRFVRAVATANLERADSCFRDAKDRFLFNLNERHWQFQARAQLEQWSLGQFMRGRRQLRLSVTYGGPSSTRSRSWTVNVTRAGLLSPMPTSGGSIGPAIDVPLTPEFPTA